MSFGYSAGEAIVLVKLAWDTVQNSRKAVGEHDELTHEASCLHIVLRRFEHECTKPDSPINKPGDPCREELESIVTGCEKVLCRLDSILRKYNTLSVRERSGRRLWHSFRFGNKYVYIRDLRSKLSYYTSTITLFLNMVSSGTIGRVEQQMDNAGGELREIRLAVNGITAQLVTSTRQDGSLLTPYPEDDTSVWKDFRRELIRDGFSSSVIEQYKYDIQEYVKELGNRGVLDEEVWHEQGPHEHHFEPDKLNGHQSCVKQHQPRGHRHHVKPHHFRVQQQDLGPHYDGSMGLGSMLAVGSMYNISSDPTAKGVPTGIFQDDSSSDSEAVSDSSSTSSEYGNSSSSSSVTRSPDPEAFNRNRRPLSFDGDRTMIAGSQLVPWDTALPLTTQTTEMDLQKPPNAQSFLTYDAPKDLRPLPLVSHYVPRQHIPQSPRFPTGKGLVMLPDRSLLPGFQQLPTRIRCYEMKRKSRSIDVDEKRRRRNSQIMNVLLGGAFVAHILVSFV